MLYSTAPTFAPLATLQMYGKCMCINSLKWPDPIPYGGKGVWDMAIKQFVTPHRGVRTNHSTVSSHTIPEVSD